MFVEMARRVGRYGMACGRRWRDVCRDGAACGQTWCVAWAEMAQVVGGDGVAYGQG